MLKKILWGSAVIAGTMAAGACLSDFAEKRPKLKKVKDKFSKTGEDFIDDCKEIGASIAEMFKTDEKTSKAKTLEEVLN